MRDPLKQAEAKRRYYLRNREQVRVRNDETRRSTIALMRRAKERPCADCAMTYPYYVMDFDHRPGVEKLGAISQDYPKWSREVLLAEIAKCDVVCSNCHRERTHRRAIGLLST